MMVVDVIFVKSGIVMLEVVLLKKLMVILYKVFWLIGQIMCWQGYLLYVGLLNILVGCFVVFELLQYFVMFEVFVDVMFMQLCDDVNCCMLIEVFIEMYFLLWQNMVVKVVEVVVCVFE